MSVFRKRFSCIRDRWGLYRFYRAWKIMSCGVLGLLEVSVSAIICHGSLYCVLFTAIFPLGYPGADVTFRSL